MAPMTGDQIMEGFGGASSGGGSSFNLGDLSNFGNAPGVASNGWLSNLGTFGLDSLKGFSSGLGKAWDASGMQDLTKGMGATDWTAAASLGLGAYDQFAGPTHDYKKALTSNVNKQNAIADQTVAANKNALKKDDVVNRYYGW